MTQYRFQLDNRLPTKLFICPGCGKRTLKLYRDNKNGEYLPEHVGRCNREVNCKYHYPPKSYYADTAIDTTVKPIDSPRNNIVTGPSFITQEILNKSTRESHLEDNFLAQYLKRVLGRNFLSVTKQFQLGTSHRWPGATVFWQIDHHGKIRSGKVMLYDAHTGKRLKGKIDWVHSILLRKGVIKSFNLRQCLFGEHQLLTFPNRPIGIVESEKTAMIATTYLPELTWMACGSLTGISEEKFTSIKSNKIILYPDINGFDNWAEKANELKSIGFNISTSELLEKGDFVTQEARSKGYDLADYLASLPPPISDLQRLEKRYPNISELVKRFDLVEVHKTTDTQDKK